MLWKSLGRGTGLQANYYSTGDWTGTPVISRVDPTLNFAWNAHNNVVNSPLEGDPYYSVTWNGTLTPRRTGWHMFNLANVVSGTLLVNNTMVDRRAHNGNDRILWLQAAKAYPIKFGYTSSPDWGVHPSSVNGIILQWVEPETNGTWAVIPQSQLSPVSPVASSGTKHKMTVEKSTK
ncbi:MAG TPA: PA14 domain-containing protein [Abditibacteriaceae bacterium]|jgi:hypothetical protein